MSVPLLFCGSTRTFRPGRLSGSAQRINPPLKQYSRRMRGTPYTPHPMQECQKKGLAKREIRKRMKTKGLFFARKKGAICKCMKIQERGNRVGRRNRIGGDFDWHFEAQCERTRGRVA